MSALSHGGDRPRLTDGELITLCNVLCNRFAVSGTAAKHYSDCNDRLIEFERVVTKAARGLSLEHDDGVFHPGLRVVHPDPTTQPHFDSDAPWDKHALTNIVGSTAMNDTDFEDTERMQPAPDVGAALDRVSLVLGRGSHFSTACNARTNIDRLLSVILSDEFMSTMTFDTMQKALCHAACYGYTDLTKWLVVKRRLSPLWRLECRFGPARALARRTSLVSPLHWSSFGGHRDLILFFIERGADPNFDCVHGFSPLMASVCYGDISTTMLLLNNGAHVNVLGHYPYRQSALHCAVDDTWRAPLAPDLAARLVTLLVHSGANVEISDVHGNTTVMTAVRAGCFSGVAALLVAGANVFSTDSAGNTALSLSYGDASIIALLSTHLLNARVDAENTCVLPNGRIWTHTNDPDDSFFDAMVADDCEAVAMAQARAQDEAEWPSHRHG